MQHRNKSRLAYFAPAFLLALATFASAAQTSTPQGSAPQAAPPAQTSSPTSPSPQSSPSSSGAQASPQRGQGASIDDELQLTPDQKQKIASVVDDENKQISAIRDDNSLSLEQKQQKVLQIRQAGAPKIKSILTPEQLQKLAAIQQRMRQQDNAPGQPPQAPPQQR